MARANKERAKAAGMDQGGRGERERRMSVHRTSLVFIAPRRGRTRAALLLFSRGFWCRRGKAEEGRETGRGARHVPGEGEFSRQNSEVRCRNHAAKSMYCSFLPDGEHGAVCMRAVRAAVLICFSILAFFIIILEMNPIKHVFFQIWSF
jgi:hypothetical protein